MHELYSITKFEIVGPYTLRLTFDDGAVKTIDFLLVLRGELYSPLRDVNFFNQVRLDQEVGTIVWPNGADFDPATLHDWDTVGPEMIEMASKWKPGFQTLQNMTLEQVMYFAHQLKPSEKIELIRLMAQDLEKYSDKFAPFEPFTTYHIYTPFFEPETATALVKAMQDMLEEKEKEDA